jgi:hypothetical protein
MRIALVSALVLALGACSQTAQSQAGSSNVAIASTAMAPTAGVPSKMSATAKSEMAKAASGPSAVQISTDPHRWAGSYVSLDCEIIKVSAGVPPALSVADALCGRGVAADLSDYPSRAATKEYNHELGDQALLSLVGGGVSKFAAGQRVKIVGLVTRGPGSVRVDYFE